MPKPRTPRQNAAYRKLHGRLTRYGLQLRALFDAFSDDVAKLVAGTGYSADSDKPFRFKDYPAAERKFKRLKEKLAKDMHALIGRTTAAEVENADKISDELAKSVIRAYGGNASNPAYSPYFVHRSAAVEAFLARRRDGQHGQHGWSKRVWDIADTNGKELELAVSAAIKDGKAATKLATEIKKYLNEPDRLFRRVRNEFGQLVLSRNAKLYHPGRGIYRSSYKNALRLAATETNVAYRQAENERWKAMDFIVGVEIHLSKSHKVEDICDELQGKYPVAFGTTWTGWHPNCLCYKTSILKTEEEFWDMDQSKPSKNEVKDMPEGWKNWVSRNKERILKARENGKEPWFIRDAPQYLPGTPEYEAFTAEIAIRRQIEGLPSIYMSRPISSSGRLMLDVTGGVATAAYTGIRSLMAQIKKASTARGRAKILSEIIETSAFKKLGYHSTKDAGIFGINMGSFDRALKTGEMPRNLHIAKKIIKSGYDVYLLPNPRGMRTADFILKKGGRLYYSEAKMANGLVSVEELLYKASTQSDMVILDPGAITNTRYIATKIKNALNNTEIKEVILLYKGKTRYISRKKANNKDFVIKLMAELAK